MAMQPTIIDEIEIHFSCLWLKDNASGNLLQYVEGPPATIQLYVKNAISQSRLRSLHPQKIEAIVIQAYGSSQDEPCNHCSEPSRLKNRFDIVWS
ncbi:hypothetical protein MMC18_000288 [Xylographa bjoerkii]|nr:hypothetical protein [Xylographa bjoerkii]